MIQIKKNRAREKYTFANINLLGVCNADCYFCLGKDIPTELEGKNDLKRHFAYWPNFYDFLNTCYFNEVYKLYITGQTADGLQYLYLRQLVLHLQARGFSVGVRTNGYLAIQKMQTIRYMDDEIGFSIHSLNKDTNKKIMGTNKIPDWNSIIPVSGNNVRISIVVNRYNIHEIDDLIKFAAAFNNVCYIQIRRISTDFRLGLLQEDIDLYEEYYKEFEKKYKQIGTFYLAQQYEVYGKEVNFWRTVETSCNSLNYFTDGTISDEYFIVEGYLKNKST